MKGNKKSGRSRLVVMRVVFVVNRHPCNPGGM